MRCARKSIFTWLSKESAAFWENRGRRSRKPADHARSNRPGQLHRQLPPDSSRSLKLGIQRRKMRDFLPSNQVQLILEGLDGHAPLGLELESASALFAATEVKDATSALDGELHELPIHKVVGSQRRSLRIGAGIVRKNGVSIKEGEDSRNGLISTVHQHQINLVRELVCQVPKKGLGEDRGTQTAHTIGEQRIEGIQLVQPMACLEPGLLGLSDHVAGIHRQLLETGVVVWREVCSEGRIEGVGDKLIENFSRTLVQFEMVNLQFVRQLLGMIQKGVMGVAIPSADAAVNREG